MFTYRAPNPYPAVNKGWVGSFFSLFASSLPSASIGSLVLPAQSRGASHDLTQGDIESLPAFRAVEIDGGFVLTHDGASLDTIQISPQSESKAALEEKYYIIKFNGNGGLYQDSIRDYADESEKLKATVIGFNYRNVGNSSNLPAKYFQELVTDGIAEVQRLIASGADPEKITLDGISLGGAIATMVASHFHKKGLRVSLWNDRSLATLSEAAAGLVAPSAPGLVNDFCYKSLSVSSYGIMQAAGWDVDVVKAYDSIPAAYKAYMVIAEKSDKSTGDGVIAHHASLHYHVMHEEKQQKMSTGHIVYSNYRNGGHNASRLHLISQIDSSITGQHLYESFVLRNRTLTARPTYTSSASSY